MTSTLDFTINVKSRSHLALIMRRLRQIPLVMRIVRLGCGASFLTLARPTARNRRM
jgi:hypothetical protein